MDKSFIEAQVATAGTVITGLALKAVGAVILYMVGRWLISFLIRVVQRSLEQQKLDPTLLRYVGTIISVLANLSLVIAILGYFGVETTSFAALLAGAGIAIGAAWGGLLSNFAAGAFLVVLRPFKAGDFVCAGDVTGTVMNVGLFVTQIETPDGVATFIGNSKAFGGTIQNFSVNKHRRVDLVAQLAGGVDVEDARKRLKERLAAIPNVVTDPAPDVEVLTFTELGPVLAVRPYTHTDHYWQVYFATNLAIVAVAKEAGYPGVQRTLVVKNAA